MGWTPRGVSNGAEISVCYSPLQPRDKSSKSSGLSVVGIDLAGICCRSPRRRRKRAGDPTFSLTPEDGRIFLKRAALFRRQFPEPTRNPCAQGISGDRPA